MTRNFQCIECGVFWMCRKESICNTCRHNDPNHPYTFDLYPKKERSFLHRFLRKLFC